MKSCVILRAGAQAAGPHAVAQRPAAREVVGGADHGLARRAVVAVACHHAAIHQLVGPQRERFAPHAAATQVQPFARAKPHAGGLGQALPGLVEGARVVVAAGVGVNVIATGRCRGQRAVRQVADSGRHRAGADHRQHGGWGGDGWRWRCGGGCVNCAATTTARRKHGSGQQREQGTHGSGEVARELRWHAFGFGMRSPELRAFTQVYSETDCLFSPAAPRRLTDQGGGHRLEGQRP
jgi:hypothetical protein